MLSIAIVGVLVWCLDCNVVVVFAVVVFAVVVIGVVFAVGVVVGVVGRLVP